MNIRLNIINQVAVEGCKLKSSQELQTNSSEEARQGDEKVSQGPLLPRFKSLSWNLNTSDEIPGLILLFKRKK